MSRRAPAAPREVVTLERLPEPPVAPALNRSGRATLVGIRAVPIGCVIAGIVAFVVGIDVLGAVLVVLGVAFGAGNAFVGSPNRVIASIRSRPADAQREARLLNILDRLCLNNGIATPQVRIVADDACNTLVLGTRKAAVLFCTEGALDRLDLIALEGVIGHELAHIKRGDLAVAARAMRSVGLFAAYFGGAGLLASVVGVRREVLADHSGVAMTRYPPGLIDTLEIFETNTTRPSLSPVLMRLTAPMWCVPLLPAKKVVPGALDVDLRLVALREL